MCDFHQILTARFLTINHEIIDLSGFAESSTYLHEILTQDMRRYLRCFCVNFDKSVEARRNGGYFRFPKKPHCEKNTNHIVRRRCSASTMVI